VSLPAPAKPISPMCCFILFVFSRKIDSTLHDYALSAELAPAASQIPSQRSALVPRSWPTPAPRRRPRVAAARRVLPAPSQHASHSRSSSPVRSAGSPISIPQSSPIAACRNASRIASSLSLRRASRKLRLSSTASCRS